MAGAALPQIVGGVDYKMTKISRILAALAPAVLAGCGVTVPAINEPWETEVYFPGKSEPMSATAQIEFQIKERIKCDLRDAVVNVQQKYYSEEGKSYPYLPANWGVSVALSLEVDEATSLNPGASFNEVFANAIHKFGPANTVTTPQTFNLGFGATLSSTASRIDKFNPFYTIADLSKLPIPSSCSPEGETFHKNGITPASSSPFILESDLGIRQWLRDATLVNKLIKSDTGGGSGTPTDTISYEIKFVIVSSGNITPTWKLVKWSANIGSTPLFYTGRIRTHDLIITVGPANNTTRDSHLASQIASGVASANKALLTGLSSPFAP